MIISEAAQKVLMDSKMAMNVSEIYQEIVNRNLYSFGAKNPKGVLAQAIYEKSDANPKAKSILFHKVRQGIYETI